MEEVVKKRRGRPVGSVNADSLTSAIFHEKRIDSVHQKQYIKEKIKVLKDFYITLTYEEERELRSLYDPLSIDMYVRRIIAKKLGD